MLVQACKCLARVFKWLAKGFEWLARGSGPHGVLNLEAKSRGTIWRCVTSHANRPILGSGKISTVQLSRPAGNSAIETGRGGLASVFKPRLRLQHGLPLVLELVSLVGGSLGVNMKPR